MKGKWLARGSTKLYLIGIKEYLLVATLTPYNGEEDSYDYSWYFCEGLDVEGFVDLYLNDPKSIKEYEVPREIGVPPEMGVRLVLGGAGKALIESLKIFKIKVIRGRVRITDEKMKSVYDKWYHQRFKDYWDTFEVEETLSCFKYKMEIKPEIYNG